MNFEFENPHTLRAYGIAPALREVIASIPAAAAGRDRNGSRDRIFPAPGSESGMVEDWESLVEPELRHLFESAERTVAKDLESLYEPQEGGGLQLRIPIKHLDAWLNCLAQARLVLAAQIDYSEKDHVREFVGPPKNPRELAIFRIELYALMQEWLIHVSEAGNPDLAEDFDESADPENEGS